MRPADLMSLPQAVTAMMQQFGRIIQLLTEIRDKEPPKRPEDRVVWLTLQDTGGRSRLQDPADITVTGLIITVDQTGDGFLTIGSQQRHFLVTAYTTLYLLLTEDNRIQLKNDDVFWTNPGSTGHYYVHLICHYKAMR